MTTATVALEAPRARHAAEFLHAVRRSRALHRGFVTPPTTIEAYKANIARFRQASHAGYLVRNPDGDLVGVVNVTEMVRGSFCSAYLGYYAFAPHAGAGYMTEALRLVLSEAFRQHDLHRLEANIQPNNARSIALVKRLGFRLEGYSPKYLRIAGKWRDHERWAITVEVWRDRTRFQRVPRIDDKLSGTRGH